MNIALAILHLFPAADPFRDFRVEDDGGGPILKAWNLTGPQPTEQQLESAWVQVQAKQAAADALMSARLAMADAFHALPEQVRADHLRDYSAIEQALIRGDVLGAKRRIETMPISTAVPEQDRETLRAQFLAFFPS